MRKAVEEAWKRRGEAWKRRGVARRGVEEAWRGVHKTPHGVAAWQLLKKRWWEEVGGMHSWGALLATCSR